MGLGNKIYELRKKENLTQEQLAEKLNVTRQTISKWELNETTPDIMQAKEIANTFNVSLDQLVDNDISSLVVEKVSNMEKLAGLTLKVSKYLGIGFLILLLIDIVSFIVFIIIR